MIFLTQEQQQRLKNASSNIFGERRMGVPQKKLKDAAREIELVLQQLHLESPSAFNTSTFVNADGDIEFEGIESELSKRHFYHEPPRLEPHKSFVKPCKAEYL